MMPAVFSKMPSLLKCTHTRMVTWSFRSFSFSIPNKVEYLVSTI